MNTGKEFEEYVHQVYEMLLNMKDDGVIVSRDVRIKGKSGAFEQIDVYYEFIQAGVKHRVAIECKEWSRKVDKGRIYEFIGKIQNIGNVNGVFISNGYQEGAYLAAKQNDILLLKIEDLPSLPYLIGERLATVALPDETYFGELFWTIMELRDGKVTGSYLSIVPQGTDKDCIPLMFSKYHAELVME